MIYFADYRYDDGKQVIAPAAVVKGQVALINDTYAAYVVDTAAGDTVTVIFRARQAIADKKVGTGEAIEVGDRVYYDTGDGLVSRNKGAVSAVDDIYVGTCLASADINDTSVIIKFTGYDWNMGY